MEEIEHNVFLLSRQVLRYGTYLDVLDCGAREEVRTIENRSTKKGYIHKLKNRCTNERDGHTKKKRAKEVGNEIEWRK